MFEALEHRTLFAGVTLITHGQAERVFPPWVSAMANAVVNRMGTDATQVRLTVHDASPSLTVSAAIVGGSLPTSTFSAEIVATIDWSSVAGGVIFADSNTREVANVLLAPLLSTSLIPGFAHALAEFPIHLIGHSRGGSLVCELAALLGEQGIWVDQLTTLDPHPRDVVTGDAPLRVTNLVGFADNYWQPNTLLTFGNPIPGQSVNTYFPSITGGYDNPHSNVHLWYHGTIDHSRTTDGEVVLTDSLRTNWYESQESGGLLAGFYYSRLGGGPRDAIGVRRNNSDPPINGLHPWLGGHASRTSITTVATPWSNVLSVTPASTSIAAGQTLAVDSLVYCDISDELRVWLDPDQNPFNGNEVSWTGAETDSHRNAPAQQRIEVSTTGVAPGSYYVRASIHNYLIGRTRYAANASPITVIAGPAFAMAAESAIATAADATGGMLVAGVNGAGNPFGISADASGTWSAVNVGAATTHPVVGTSPTSWLDRKDGLYYVAACAVSGVIVYRRDAQGVWSSRNLTTGLAGSALIVSGIGSFAAADGRVFISGLGPDGHVIAYEQTGQTDTLGWQWRFTDISVSDLTPQGQATPAFSGELVAYVTSWDAWNIVGLDRTGHIQAVWRSHDTNRWNAIDLSEQTGAPALSGRLSVYLTAWGAMNLVGTDQSGSVSATWWVPGSVWTNSDLTASSSGPKLRQASLASFVTSWGAMNVVGLDDSGVVTCYWWAPDTNRWQVAPLGAQTTNARPMARSLLGSTTSRNVMSILGVCDDGHVERYFWAPGSSWQAEDLTALVS